ncbi:MAG: YheC/YheD family protein [Hydrogenibacillus sp.]|nr:YheC/YheD family protein [Hydrogenibacillus sp.]
MRMVLLFWPCPKSARTPTEPFYTAALSARARVLGIDFSALPLPPAASYAAALWPKRRPDVFYDRTFPCPGPGSRALSAARRSWISRLRAAGDLRLNAGLPDKWRQFTLWMRDPELRAHLPAQTLFTAPEALWRLDRPAVVLKPRAGAFGRGVIAVDLRPPYAVLGRDGHNRPFVRRFEHQEALLQFLRPYLGRAIVQEKLSLSSSIGTPFDVRVLVQWRAGKDGEEDQQVYDYVRLGVPGGLTANLKGGGTAVRLETAARRLRRPDLLGMRQAIHRLAQRAAEALAAAFPPQIEMGMDFGVDRDGRLWLLEANGKPGRMGLLGAHGRETFDASLDALLLTARARWHRTMRRKKANLR